MTWDCPNCKRAYPDSALKVPRQADADSAVGCQTCFESPAGLAGFRRPAEDKEQ